MSQPPRRQRAVIGAPAGFMCMLGLLVLHAGACDARRPVAPAPIAMSVPVTVSPMGSPEEKPRVVVDPAVLPPLISDEEAIAQMDDAMKQGRVFRHLFVGGMRGISVTRITWVLRDTVEEAALDVFCEAFHRGPGVRKKSPSGWRSPAKTRAHVRQSRITVSMPTARLAPACMRVRR